ncbi:hypothetical protein [Zooshikella harenae]|uniref:AAA domain-containing protein n=1 Tax=Zooshikella harenae TaxID=2827238 RepID=A0ABS5ZFB8_9GAMM|nr:hypothetical protein [Zooshikella harenae]MBU2712764.1 hypothetical protein [Zooshikella harenae]
MLTIPCHLSFTSSLMERDQASLFFTAPHCKAGCSSSIATIANAIARHISHGILVIDGHQGLASLTNQLLSCPQKGFYNLVHALEISDINPFIFKEPKGMSYDFLPFGQDYPLQQPLERHHVKNLLRELAKLYKYILFDGPPVFSSPEVVTMAAQFDGVALVLQAEKTRWEVAQAAVERLQQGGANVFGAVLNQRKYYMPKWVYDLL